MAYPASGAAVYLLRQLVGIGPIMEPAESPRWPAGLALVSMAVTIALGVASMSDMLPATEQPLGAVTTATLVARVPDQ